MRPRRARRPSIPGGTAAEPALRQEHLADAAPASLALAEPEEPEADELPAEPEVGLAFDEDVEERTEEALPRRSAASFRRMFGVFERSQIDDELWDELEEILILADTGAETTERILAAVRQRVRKEGLNSPAKRVRR